MKNKLVRPVLKAIDDLVSLTLVAVFQQVLHHEIAELFSRDFN